MGNKLFAVYLGGRAPKCNTELHDIVFVTGEAIDQTYQQLIDRWFGTPKGLHIDSWIELDIVDGYKISLSENAVENKMKLYFVNLGAYKENEFSEIHANKFLVAESVQEAKLRAKTELLIGWPERVHTDDIYEIESCVELNSIGAFHIGLTKTSDRGNLKPNNGYHVIPKSVIEDHMKRNGIEEPERYRKPFK
jgi:hypothetical protein